MDAKGFFGGPDRAPGSLFQSSRNIEIEGGQFSSARGHHTNLTINFNQTALDDENEFPPTSSLPTPERSFQRTENDVAPFQSRELGIMQGEHTRRTSLPVQRSCDIYYRQLAVKGRGSPLWIPEPNDRLPIEYRRKGICVGDVGIITDYGGFDFMFNICLPRDHPINPNDLPDDFISLRPPLKSTDIRGYTEFKMNSYLQVHQSRDHSETVIHPFETSASEGAILTMPQGAYSEKLGNVALFKNYLSVHSESWYKYVNGVRGREAKNGDVRLVIGCDKSATWGMATFSNLTEHNNALRLKFKAIGERSFGRTYGWEYSGMAEVRAGPDPQEIEDLRMNEEAERDVVYKNLCLFMETLNAKLNDDVWNKLSSESGMLSVPESADPSSNSTASTPGSPVLGASDSYDGSRPSAGQSNPRLAQTRANVQSDEVVTSLKAHPSNIINDFLRKEKPGAKVAITEDANWISAITEADDSLPTPEELFSRIMKTHDVSEENGVVSLNPKAAHIQSFPEQVRHIPMDLSMSDVQRNSVQSHGQGEYMPYATLAYHPTRKRGKLPKQTTDYLKDWLHRHSDHPYASEEENRHSDHPYASEEEKKQLCHATGLSMSQVSNWMINARRHILVPAHRAALGQTTTAPFPPSNTGASLTGPDPIKRRASMLGPNAFQLSHPMTLQSAPTVSSSDGYHHSNYPSGGSLQHILNASSSRSPRHPEWQMARYNPGSGESEHSQSSGYIGPDIPVFTPPTLSGNPFFSNSQSSGSSTYPSLLPSPSFGGGPQEPYLNDGSSHSGSGSGSAKPQ
ncbi:hypothetical protein M413DRAFT_23455 [Hebeloma cylindrosporum]|uniref:Homeobox domain-containing protein n=1 Tax=Hebeloma cylindrosporum TaxID=76867 RepID=A0A0C2Z1Z1_HEBCY|nr:hypothetical protein M413DRAFT_23455 [Hebeloma cylindrosporum h7]